MFFNQIIGIEYYYNINRIVVSYKNRKYICPKTFSHKVTNLTLDDQWNETLLVMKLKLFHIFFQFTIQNKHINGL
jgi:hypothetical protein